MLRELVTLERSSPAARLLIVTSGWPTSERPAYGVFIRRQVESVVAEGLECDVMFIRGFESQMAYVVAAGRLAWWSLAPNRIGRRYKLVHAHGGEAALSARFYFRAPLVVSFLGSDVLGAGRADGTLSGSQRFRAAAISKVAHLAAATITKAAIMEPALPARARRRNTVLPNGVDRTVFVPADKAAAREELGWSQTERIVLFAAATSVPLKRYGLAQAACADAIDRVGPIRLHVAEGVAPELMPTLMNAADCLLHTSASEGSPNVIKEALACDLPVIATPAGDIAEVLAGVSACHVCDATANSLGAALAACLEAGEVSDGREKTEWLDQGQIARRLAVLYRSVAGCPS